MVCGEPLLSDFYEKYDLSRRYNHPRNVTFADSYFGDGKYPPDWGCRRTDVSAPIGGRRNAIYEYQGGRCARCCTNIIPSEFNCHHYLALERGGKHDLHNLIGLCLSCHKLIHPDVDELDGNWHEAPLLPSVAADPRMATIRIPVTTTEQRRYLPGMMLVEEESSPAENERALSVATYAIGPGDALSAADDFDRLLDEMEIHFNSKYTVHVLNGDGISLFDATVELRVARESGDNIRLSETTNRDGKAHFKLPPGRDIKGIVTKGQLGPVSFVDTAESGLEGTEIVLS